MVIDLGGAADMTKLRVPKVKQAKREDGSVEFVYKLDGNLRDMSVFELAPALQAMGVTLREANRTLFPQSTDMRVAVKPIDSIACRSSATVLPLYDPT